MAGRLKKIIWIVVGIAVVCILGVIGMAGAGIYYVSKHVKASEASPALAARSFDDARKMFANQPPLVELNARGDVVRTNLAGRPASAKEPEAVYMLAYDPDEGKLVRFSVPFWILKLAGDGAISFDDNKFDLERLQITVDDLKRIGPTLLVDHKSERGEHVLVWSQ